jgi:hypothetical protein
MQAHAPMKLSWRPKVREPMEQRRAQHLVCVGVTVACHGPQGGVAEVFERPEGFYNICIPTHSDGIR